jgi:dTDP-4-dehydrorhamnose reductase
MILLLGATGYVGQQFVQELTTRHRPFAALSRKSLDYTRFDALLKFLREQKPEFVVNCAGYTGKPNVDACEEHKADTLAGNTLFAQTLAHACSAAGIPWGHVSSGCIFAGAHVVQAGTRRVVKDLTTPEMRELLAKDRSAFHGFTETDVPNFSFRDGPTSFYSGTKALGEEAVAGVGQGFLWRLRIPFDHRDNARNYLSKVQRYSKVYDNVNSVSHLGDFARACLDLWDRRAPFGTYNVINPGFLTTREVVTRIEQVLKPDKRFEFWASDEEFYRVAAKTPRSNCIMDASKLLGTGVKMRPVDEAVDDALRNWLPETKK